MTYEAKSIEREEGTNYYIVTFTDDKTMRVGQENDYDLDQLYRRADATRALYKYLNEQRDLNQVIAWAVDRVKSMELSDTQSMEIIDRVSQRLLGKRIP